MASVTSRHTYQQGIIGNCAYIAHIDKTASVNWLCWPNFDSPFLFGALLDDKQGGHFSIQAINPVQYRQEYIGNTNMLVTEVITREGVYKVIDFAPRFYQFERYFKPLMLFRKIELVDGEPQVIISCRPRYELGAKSFSTTKGSNHIRYHGLDQQLRLTTNIPLTYIEAEQPFYVTGTHRMVLSYGNPLEAPLETVFDEFQKRTEDYWRSWVRYSTIPNFEQKAVIRSVLALKLHQFEDTGAIIAASTTSLPEHDGSGRNWDYRYCWIRDTYYTLKALRLIGQGAELERYANYIRNLPSNAEGRYQPVYSISGGAQIDEEIIDLPGYRGNNRPVRIGNQAREHIQNDVYGQMLVSLLPLFVDERFAYSSGHLTSVRLVHEIVDKILELMDEPDAGLWEFRNVEQRHCYTYLFHWAGGKAAERISDHMGDDALRTKAIEAHKRAAIGIEECYDPQRKIYTQAIGSQNLDASLLQLITMNYLPHDSERARNHLLGLEKELKSQPDSPYFFRYKHQDDFGLPETTFLICAFWYVEALACVGRLDEAVAGFRRLIDSSNHLGLLSEDVSATDFSQWGNFPQTYSHVGVVNAAFRIAMKLDLTDLDSC